jgi:hypothetical protein
MTELATGNVHKKFTKNSFIQAFCGKFGQKRAKKFHMIQKLYAYGEQLCGKECLLTACAPVQRKDGKAFLFPAFGGPWTKLKKAPGLYSTEPAEENSRDAHIL